VDGGMHAEKTLSGASRLEPLHFALSSPHRLMRIFRPMVLSPPLLIRAGQSQPPECRGVRAPLVGDHQPKCTTPAGYRTKDLRYALRYLIPRRTDGGRPMERESILTAKGSTLFILTSQVAMPVEAQPPSYCVWRGTAPFCAGECEPGEEGSERTAFPLRGILVLLALRSCAAGIPYQHPRKFAQLCHLIDASTPTRAPLGETERGFSSGIAGADEIKIGLSTYLKQAKVFLRLGSSILKAKGVLTPTRPQ